MVSDSYLIILAIILLYFRRNDSFLVFFFILIFDVKFISGLLWINLAAGELLRKMQGMVWSKVDDQTVVQLEINDEMQIKIEISFSVRN